jgi:hypothetical protein
MLKHLILGSAIGLMSVSSFANDGIGSVATGGITLGKTTDIGMKKEVLNVAWNKISVDYDFLNESNEDKTESIIFPLPRYGANYGYSDAYYGEPNKFLVLVNGKKVDFHTHIQAYLKNKNITQELIKLGLTPEQMAFFPNSSPFDVKVKQFSSEQIKSLKAKGYLTDETSDSSLAPAWDVEVSYQWNQTFPHGQILKVHHEYQPFVATGPGFYVIEKDFPKKYCADNAFINKVNHLNKNPEGEAYSMVPAAYVSYILETGNTWKNGIEDFTLNLNKQNPNELVSLCFPGDFKKVSPTTLQVHLTNFKPQQNLDVYFGNIDMNDKNYSSDTVAPKIK